MSLKSMRITRRTVAALLIIGAVLGPLPSSALHLHPAMTQGQLVDRMAAAQLPPLIDVRTPAEYRSGHIPGAINIPLQDFQRRFSELDGYRDREVVLYCETGARADYGGRWLKSQGFAELRFLDGHMGAWREAGLPTER
jgi:phage shock protein E